MDGGRPEAWEEVLAEQLRLHYRCSQCRKSCSVPCRFTLAEFRHLQQVIRDESIGTVSFAP